MTRVLDLGDELEAPVTAARVGDHVFWCDEAGQAWPAVITVILVGPKTGQHEGDVVLTVFGRYNVESNVVAMRSEKRKAEHWTYATA